MAMATASAMHSSKNLENQNAPHNKPHAAAPLSTRMQPYRRSGSSSSERLWTDYFIDPSQWWDIRKSKTSPRSPDFKHKITKESLWIDDRYSPSWVKDMLQKTESAGKDMHIPKALEARENTDWEMLSLEEAVASLEQMAQPPSVEILACILRKCRKMKNLAYALRLHAYMDKAGLDAHRSLGNYLVPMLVEVGSMSNAQKVFDRLVDRNEHSWTSLIAGYVECGKSQHAIMLYQKMEMDSVRPSAFTFVALLKACARLKDVERGQEIHAEIAKKGLLERNPFVGNALIDMYAKCGSLAKAREVFDKLPVRDVVSWNALIAGYAEHGPGQEALNCLECMQLAGISPNAITFVCSLKACGSVRAIDKGQELHTEIARKKLLERDPFVGNALVDMYAKCGSLAKAREVLKKLPIRDAVSWNALIAGYADHGPGQEALNCFKEMQLESISPDAVTFVCILKACGSIGAIDKGQEIHAEMARKGLLGKNNLIHNALVDMYAKCGSLVKAQEVFDKLPVRDAVSWTALIAGYAEHGPGQEALNCFEQMQLEGISPNAVTFVCSLKACGSIGAIDKGQEIHSEIVRNGLLEKNYYVGSALVDMYAKCGVLAKAQEVFDELPVRDAVSWTALIAGYANHGPEKEALNCFRQMQREGISPDAVTFVSSLNACARIGAIDMGREIHAEIARKRLLERDPFVGNALVDMYAKCGLFAKAQEVFDKLPIQDAVSWNALIAGYAHLGESENVFHMLDRMGREGIKPNGVTFLTVLTVCSHTGLVDKGQMYFKAMSKEYGIAATIEHYICMVDLLGRAGQLDEAIKMINKMPFSPNQVVWHTVLGACQKWGNVDLGRKAFEHAIQLDEKDASAYILMSNIYADAHMQEDAEKIEAMRVKKTSMEKVRTELVH